ncbi:MAG: hypothetical protein ACYCXR_09320 [Coriobacteriia bacterium]
MRRLTFEGYLGSYVRQLAGQNTSSLSSLVRRAQTEPRLVEPLLLWAVVSGRADRLSRLLDGQLDRERDLKTLVALWEEGRLESELATNGPSLKSEFTKVWRSYVVRRDAPTRDAELKLEARKRVLALEAAKGMTRYRMAKDLGLNPGNLHAFLAQGNVSKVSLNRAYELVDYLEAA